MQNKVFTALAIAGIFNAFFIFKLLQDLNGKLSELAPNFHAGSGGVTDKLLILAIALLAGAGLQLLLSFSKKTEDPKLKKQVQNLLASLKDESSSDNKDADSPDPVRELSEKINQLRTSLMDALKRERAVSERAVDVICLIDINFKFLSVSKACINSWGYAPEELENRHLADILLSDSKSPLDSIIGSEHSKDNIKFECQLKKKNGELIDVVWTGHWSVSDLHLFCIVHDITTRKRAELAMKESEERLRTILQALPAGVLLVNDDSIEFANVEAEQMLLLPGENLTGAPVAQVFPSMQNLPSQLSTAIRTDKTNFPVQISVRTLELQGEERQVLVFVDKTAEQEAERIKRRFLAMLTHDIRTPLTAFNGILTLLEQGELGVLNDRGLEITRGVRSNCQRLLRLLSEMLDVEKARAGKFDIEFSELSVQILFELAVDNVAPLAHSGKIDLEIVPTDLLCRGDEDRLVQVLVNLLSNAIKFSPAQSKVKLIAEALETMVKISVLDFGRGIPESKLNAVFEEFEQVSRDDALASSGTGLGLAICKTIVTGHGGELRVDSQPEKGSCFWFTVPIVILDEEQS